MKDEMTLITEDYEDDDNDNYSITIYKEKNGSLSLIDKPIKDKTEKEKLLDFINVSRIPLSPKNIRDNLEGFNNKTIQNVTQMMYKLNNNDGLITKIGKGQYVSLDYNQRVLDKPKDPMWDN